MSAVGTKPSFKDDQSGAITVMAVFMAAFLIGIMFWMSGTGDAIIYREVMQDASDATAFSAAVYDARGMNMIALINLIMAAFMAVMIFLNIVFYILQIAAAVTAASIILFPLSPPIEDAADMFVEPAINTYTPIAYSWLKGLNIAADGMAVLMPWVAEAKSVSVAASYGTPVSSGFTASVSQVPGIIAATAISTVGIPTGAPRIGLPVSNGPFSNLCKEGGQIVDNLFNLGLGAFNVPGSGAVESILSTALQAALQWFPQFFCGRAPFDQAAAQSNIDQSCNAQEQAWVRDPHNHGVPFNMAQCQHDETTRAQEAQWTGQQSDEAPKIVFLGAFAGSDYFTVYSWTQGTFRTMGGGGVDVAAWRPGAVNTPGSPHSFAKAEFFFDQGASSAGNGQPLSSFVENSVLPQSVTGIAVNAMYNMRWRARLRRYRYLTPALGGALAGIGAGELRDAIRNVNVDAYNVLSVTGVFLLAQQAIESVGADIDSAIGGALSSWSTDDNKVVH